MTTWKQDHVAELAQRQAHVRQKLRQLREIQRGIELMKTRLGPMREWLRSLVQASDGSDRAGLDLFDPEVFVRMGSIAVFLKSVFGAMAATDGQTPAATGTREGGMSEDQAAHAYRSAQVMDMTGGLGSQVPLTTFTDQFGITNKLREDGIGWAFASEVWNAFTSPFETYQRHKFTLAAQDEILELYENDRDAIFELGASLGEALSQLDLLDNELNWSRDLDSAIAELEGSLTDMERVYDQAGGEGPSSSQLQGWLENPPGLESLDSPTRACDGSMAWADSSGFGECDYEPLSDDAAWDRLTQSAEARYADLDYGADDAYDPSADPDLAGLDDLPGLDD